MESFHGQEWGVTFFLGRDRLESGNEEREIEHFVHFLDKLG